MFLYNLTLKECSDISFVIHGHFCGTNGQEIVIARRKSIELLQIDTNLGKIVHETKLDLYGTIGALLSFKLPSDIKDYVVVCLDSGYVVILEYMPVLHVFEVRQKVTYVRKENRTIFTPLFVGDHRGTPILYGCLDSVTGKNCMSVILFTAQKQFRPISTKANTMVSNSTLIYTMAAIDNAPNTNPMFACLEIDPKKSLHQMFNVYEMDLNTSRLEVKHSEEFQEHANMLITVPGGNDGPSGLLICFEDYFIYRHVNNSQQTTLRSPIPRRKCDYDLERGMIFICCTTYKRNSVFFFLVQSEQGDVFKITLDIDKETVVDIKLKYLDTLPLATNMCILDSGLLFVAAEYGNHYLYQIAYLGDDDDELEFSLKRTSLEESDTFFFTPTKLRNLILVNEIKSISPVLSAHITNANGDDESATIYTLCGRGPRSSLRILRHGVTLDDVRISTKLPENPIALWPLKRNLDDTFDEFLLVTFHKSTMLLSIDDQVEEVTNIGFLTNVSTLGCCTINSHTFIQIHAGGIWQIRADKSVCEWKSSKRIEKCTLNQSQIVLALTDGELVYFQLDSNCVLIEHEVRQRMGADILCLSMPTSDQKARLLAVGLADKTVRLLSLDASDYFTIKSTQELPSCPESVCVTEIDCTTRKSTLKTILYLHVGLQNGALHYFEINPVNCSLTNAQSRYLGGKPVTLARIRVGQSDCVLANGNKPWLNYFVNEMFSLIQLGCESVENVCGFSSPLCPDGFITINASILQFVALNGLDCKFSQKSVPLEYTPRKLAVHSDCKNVVLIESEHNCYTEETKNQLRCKLLEEMREQQIPEEMVDEFLKERDLPECMMTSPKAGNGAWASLLRIVDPIGKKSKTVRFCQSESAFSLCLLKFNNFSEWFVVVGVVKDFQLDTRQLSEAFINTYKLDNNSLNAEFVHKTALNCFPTVLCAFNGGLLAAIGTLLCFYQMGSESLLCKCEFQAPIHSITNIQTVDNRIFLSNIRDSVLLLCYKVVKNQFVVLVVDSHPKWITCATLLDRDTIVTGDKFGNVVVLRAPANLLEEIDDCGVKRFDVIASFHVAESVVSLHKVNLVAGGWETIVYVTLTGTIGILAPLTEEEKEVFESLEVHLRKEVLFGENHKSFRSVYYPVKNVVDGDLCEQYNHLDATKQKNIGNLVKKTTLEVGKMLMKVRKQFFHS